MAHSPGIQPLPRVRGDAPATGLSMRVIGMNPGRSARDLGAGEMATGAISAGFVMRGSDPLGERIGNGGSDPRSDGWVAFRVRRDRLA